MPSSTKSRPTTDHEYIFFFTKSPDYYYDADAIREPHVTFSDKSRMRGGPRAFRPPRRHAGGRQERRHEQPPRRPLGPGFSSARAATSGPSGRSRSPSSARPTSPSFPSRSSRPAFRPAARPAASCSIRSSAAAPCRSSPGSSAATTWASTASPTTAKWPASGWRPRRLLRKRSRFSHRAISRDQTWSRRQGTAFGVRRARRGRAEFAVGGRGSCRADSADCAHSACSGTRFGPG